MSFLLAKHLLSFKHFDSKTLDSFSGQGDSKIAREQPSWPPWLLLGSLPGLPGFSLGSPGPLITPSYPEALARIKNIHIILKSISKYNTIMLKGYKN